MIFRSFASFFGDKVLSVDMRGQQGYGSHISQRLNRSYAAENTEIELLGKELVSLISLWWELSIIYQCFNQHEK